MYSYKDTLRSIESATDEAQEIDFDIEHTQLPGTSSSQLRTKGLKLYDLSGRTRATLKQYFDEVQPFSLPQGQPTVAFTESQLYHLLRVLTNETVSMSYKTMERMVISAVKGTPVTSKSRTVHIKTFKRARTFFPSHSSGTDSEEFKTPATHEPFTEEEASTGDETGDSTFHEESDSAGEMAHIEQNFIKPTTSIQVGRVRALEDLFSTRENSEASDTICPDETLSQVREHAIAEKTFSSCKGKQAGKRKRVKKRGVPMRKEFFSKIGWTRCFISGPADPLHNPYTFWCHVCERTFLSAPKDQRRYCVITGLKSICTKTNASATNI